MKRKKLMHTREQVVKNAACFRHYLSKAICMHLHKDKYIPIEIISEGLSSTMTDLKEATMRACEGRYMPKKIIKEWLSSENTNHRIAAINTYIGKDYSEEAIGVIKAGLSDEFITVASAAIKACEGMNIPSRITKEWLRYAWPFRAAVINTYKNKKIPLDVIEQGLLDVDFDVRSVAVNACKEANMPVKTIGEWLQKEEWQFKAAALNAYIGRDILTECIEEELNSEHIRIRTAAVKAYGINNLPLIRTFEPPRRVYKKCMEEIIVIAEIPKDAQVRGQKGEKCRASKAIIIDIIGDIDGIKAGRSCNDPESIYFIGDIIEIDDFDYSNRECSTGFHFFCSKKEAKEY